MKFSRLTKSLPANLFAKEVKRNGVMSIEVPFELINNGYFSIWDRVANFNGISFKNFSISNEDSYFQYIEKKA